MGQRFGNTQKNVIEEPLTLQKLENSGVYYYKDPSFECDFVVTHGSSVQQLIQVSYDITSPKTRARELNGEIIHILPATEWLANRK